MRQLICAAAASLLLGCANVPGLPAHLVTLRATLPDSGGTFSVKDSGYWSLVCGPFHFYGFSFDGSGSGTFIHGNKENGLLSCNRTGSATIVSKQHPSDSITMALSARYLPCVHGPTALTFTIDGGSWRFANAKGSGTVTFDCKLGNRAYSDMWSGTISF